MLKRLALIFIVAAGLFALQPEVPLATRFVAATEFVVGLVVDQQEEITYVESSSHHAPLPNKKKSEPSPGFTSLQSQLIRSQYFHSSLPVVA